MNYQKILLFLCALTTAKATFGMEQKASSRPKPRSTLIKKEEKKPNTTVEILKGLVGLSGSAFFIYALINSEKAHKNLISKTVQGLPTLAPMGYLSATGKQQYNLTPQSNANPCGLSSALQYMVKLSSVIIPLSGNYNAGAAKKAEIIRTTYTAISALGSYILGKYGLTKLYNAFKNK